MTTTLPRGVDACTHCDQHSAVYQPFPTCRACSEPTCPACAEPDTARDRDERPTVMCRSCAEDYICPQCQADIRGEQDRRYETNQSGEPPYVLFGCVRCLPTGKRVETDPRTREEYDAHLAGL